MRVLPHRVRPLSGPEPGVRGGRGRGQVSAHQLVAGRGPGDRQSTCFRFYFVLFETRIVRISFTLFFLLLSFFLYFFLGAFRVPEVWCSFVAISPGASPPGSGGSPRPPESLPPGSAVCGALLGTADGHAVCRHDVHTQGPAQSGTHPLPLHAQEVGPLPLSLSLSFFLSL